MTWYSREDAAERAGVDPDYLVRLVDLGILAPEDGGPLLAGRRAPRADGEVARGCRDPARRCGRCDPARRPLARLPRRGRLRAVRRPRPRDVPTGQRPHRGSARAADGHPRSDRHGATVARRPTPRGRDGDRAVHRAPDRRGVPAGCDRASPPCPGRQHPSDRRAGGRVVELRGDRAGPSRGQGLGRDRERRPRRSDLPALGAGRAGDVPRPSGARLDRQHHRRLRETDGDGGDPQPPRATSGDLLPRHHAATRG